MTKTKKTIKKAVKKPTKKVVVNRRKAKKAPRAQRPKAPSAPSGTDGDNRELGFDKDSVPTPFADFDNDEFNEGLTEDERLDLGEDSTPEPEDE